MDATIRSRSIILSVLIHLGLFLILLFVVMTTPIPPFPEAGGGGGVIVNIGYVDEASGLVQPMSENTTVDPAVNKVIPAPQPEEKIATQDLEDASISDPKKDTKKTVVKPVTTDVKTKKDVKQPAKPVETVDPRAIYKGKTTTSASQGTGQGTGDQGDPHGDPNSKYTGKNGTGGPGTGTGEGTGTGPGKGDKISFELSGRHLLRSPAIDDKSQETGKVVVNITVDKQGSVVAAVPGGRGSTTTSSYLYKLAQEAAMKTKFSANPDAADIQKGTITFVFVVQ